MLIRNSRAQGMVEYLILVALIAAGTIGIVRVVGYNIGVQYENLNRAMGAKTSNQLQVQNAEQGLLNKKDLSNFLQGVRLLGKRGQVIIEAAVVSFLLFFLFFTLLGSIFKFINFIAQEQIQYEKSLCLFLSRPAEICDSQKK